MTQIQKQWLVRILIGGSLGAALTAVLAYRFNGMFGDYTLVSAEPLAYFGSYALALVAELGAGFALGAALGVSTLPFDEVGRSLAKRSVLHFAVTGSFVFLLGWAFCWFGSGLTGALLLLVIYLFIYFTVWLVRYLGWRAELNEMRAALGLCAPRRGKEDGDKAHRGDGDHG